MPDTAEIGHGANPNYSRRIWLLVGLALCVIIGIVGAVGVIGTRNAVDNTAFMSKCIEFHSVDRCSDFWRYKRLDLAERPGR